VTLSPGTYLFAFNSSGTTATVNVDWDVTSIYQILGNKNGVVVGTGSNASSGGQLPSSLGTLSAVTNNTVFPIVWFAS